MYTAVVQMACLLDLRGRLNGVVVLLPELLIGVLVKTFLKEYKIAIFICCSVFLKLQKDAIFLAEF